MDPRRLRGELRHGRPRALRRRPALRRSARSGSPRATSPATATSTSTGRSGWAAGSPRRCSPRCPSPPQSDGTAARQSARPRFCSGSHITWRPTRPCAPAAERLRHRADDAEAERLPQLHRAHVRLHDRVELDRLVARRGRPLDHVPPERTAHPTARSGGVDHEARPSPRARRGPAGSGPSSPTRAPVRRRPPPPRRGAGPARAARPRRPRGPPDRRTSRPSSTIARKNGRICGQSPGCASRMITRSP